MNPAGQVVLLTGASAGIGAATAYAFAQAGAQLVLVARDRDRLEAIRQALPAGRHTIIPADLGSPSAVASLAEQVLATCGPPALIIHNAGVGLAAPIATMPAADLQQALAVNLFGPLQLTQALLPAMRTRGHGQIIFVSSTVGLRALPYLGGYAASKAALDRITEALRVELHGSGIVVTLIRPGTTKTGFSGRRLGQGYEIRRRNTPGVPPEQVAQAILRAAIREPRIAYVRLLDRLIVWFGLLAPGLTDRLLGRSFGWQETPPR
jgi:short-subunit dehydrogenase